MNSYNRVITSCTLCEIIKHFLFIPTVFLWLAINLSNYIEYVSFSYGMVPGSYACERESVCVYESIVLGSKLNHEYSSRFRSSSLIRTLQ